SSGPTSCGEAGLILCWRECAIRQSCSSAIALGAIERGCPASIAGLTAAYYSPCTMDDTDRWLCLALGLCAVVPHVVALLTRCRIDFRRASGQRGGDRERDRPRRAHGSGRRLPGGVRCRRSAGRRVEWPGAPPRPPEQGKCGGCTGLDPLGLDRWTTPAATQDAGVRHELADHRSRILGRSRNCPLPVRQTARDRSRVSRRELLRW